VSEQCILVVDDDAAIRGLIRLVLRRDNYNVEEAINGEEAMARMRIKKYDAVVLDLMMGPGNGVEVLDALKTKRPGEKCVIVVSATSERTINQLDGENIFAKIRKPFDVDDLLRAVRECVEQ